MPSYRYRAVNLSGRIAQGNLAAANEWELNQYLSHAGLELIEARVKKEATSPLRIMRRRLPPRTLSVFAGQMLDLLKAGVVFLDALREVATTSEDAGLRDTLADILRSINHGSRIATAFGQHPRLFPPVFLSILAAGEASGNLNETFTHLARYAETRARMQEQLRRALRYPLFLIAVAFATTGFMMTMVVPKVIGFLNAIDNQLPLATRILIAASDVFAECWWAIALLAFMGISLTGFLRRHSEGAALTIDGFILRLPVMGNVLKKLALARFAHSFAILFQSGAGMLASLRSARSALGNRALEAVMHGIEQQVQAGRSLSMAMTGTLPGFAVRMIRTGEQSGQLGKSLDDIATAYDREVAEATDRMIATLEPALTLVIGAMLAWVVLAVLGPIYASLGKLSGMGY
jgi:type IV pilus assembly protein PilC